MPVDSIHDREAARKIIELHSEISSLRSEVHTLRYELDRKVDRHDPEFWKVDGALFNLRMWCLLLTLFLATTFVTTLVIAAKLP